jgi:hypothetical protein
MFVSTVPALNLRLNPHPAESADVGLIGLGSDPRVNPLCDADGIAIWHCKAGKFGRSITLKG